MAKRSNDGSDADDSPMNLAENENSKRMRVTFESVRLPAVSNVNDISSRVGNYQAFKLAERLRYKDKKIIELERENERLRRRQETDENNLYRIHRNGLEIESQVLCAARSELDMESKHEIEGDDHTIGTSEMLQLDPEQYEKQSGRQRERIVNVFKFLAQNRQKRAEKMKIFAKKLSKFMENPSASTSDDTIKVLSNSNHTLTEENVRLVNDNSRLQQELSSTRSKLRQKEDECEILIAKKEEITRELEETKFEADKTLRLANKFEHRLCTLAKELQKANETSASLTTTQSSSQQAQSHASKKMNGQVNGSPGETTCNTKELEMLRIERDEQFELASRRLQEVNEMSTKVQKLTADLNKLKAMETIVPSSNIYNSEEYKNLQKYYSLAIKEYERVSKELEEVTNDRDRLRSSFTSRLETVKTEHEHSQKQVKEKSERINEEYQQHRQEYDVLRTEFEQALMQTSHTMTESKQADIKAILTSMKVQNHVLKQEVLKYKKKWKDTVSAFSKEKRECEELKAKLENNLLIILDGEDKDDSSSDHLKQFEEINEMGNGLGEKDLLQRLRKKNEALIKEIKSLGIADRSERLRYFEKEIQKRLSDKIAELESQKKQLEAYENSEKALSEELENIGSALEELQEHNGSLIAQKRDLEDKQLKLMNERIVSTTMLAKINEKNAILEKMLQKEKNTNQINDFEMNTMKTMNETYQETLKLKTIENSRLSIALENHRKGMQELGLSRDDLKIKNEKYELQLKHYEEILGTKSAQVENLLHKKNRIEEDYNLLKKKYERIQKSETYGSTDAVLAEENRQLKETLTCPSCKTKQKDCIMLKCYHLFCESCIKARYDTRQRKCPKCNSGFGANDFHRVFI